MIIALLRRANWGAFRDIGSNELSLADERTAAHGSEPMSAFGTKRTFAAVLSDVRFRG
jgi:hypothetical protein